MNNKKLEELITWKTEAWKATEMVSWYAGRMIENSGTNQLKNAVEVGLFEKFVVGTEVLDVGIGTGRASLPLLKRGFRVTGVDSSQAMLDECKRQAGGLPIHLQVGDVCALPFPNGCFDSLISLNVMTHFPHWEDVLTEWRRVVKSGGRIVFDIYSLDHLGFVEGKPVTVADMVERGADVFSMHLSTTDLFRFADEIGLRVVSVVPYGAVFGSQYRRFNAGAPLSSLNWWQRHLSWLATDESLFEATLFLETNFFSCLTSKATGRYMVVLDNEPDISANRLLREQLVKVDRLLEGKVTLESLAPYLSLPVDKWKETFSQHMVPLRNRIVAYLLLTCFLARPAAVDFASFFTEEQAAEMEEWLERELFDWSTHRIIEDWNAFSEIRSIIHSNGFPVEGCVEYEFTRAIMTNAKNNPTETHHE